MEPYYEADIEITKLLMDGNNSRHQRKESQREIIEWMTSGEGKMGEKLVELAKSIVEYGLSPLDRIAVIASEDNEDEYVVLEGNRRLTAIKLLNNPETAPTKNWIERFKKIKGKNFSAPKTISCVVCSDLKAAFYFIELKHLSGQGGAGTVPWGPEQKVRHEKRVERKSSQYKSLQLLDYVRTSGNVDAKTKKLTENKFPLTTLDRLLSDVEFREFLGINIGESGDIEFILDPKEALKPIVKVIRDFGAGGGKNVRDVINKDKREEYKKTFKSDSLPDRSKALATPVVAAPSSTNGSTSSPTPTTASGGKRYIDPRNRRYLLIPGTTISINARKYNRARRIFEEMKALEIKDNKGKPLFPNSGALLLRLFHEVSVTCYILDALKTPHSSGKPWKEIPLTEKTRIVLKDIESKNILTQQEVRVVTKALGDSSKIANPNSLNEFVHNINQVPNPYDLMEVWDTYTKFYIVLWDLLS
jgi:hypothetical protein